MILLQVEHPCTEMVANVNLPAAQLMIFIAGWAYLYTVQRWLLIWIYQLLNKWFYYRLSIPVQRWLLMWIYQLLNKWFLLQVEHPCTVECLCLHAYFFMMCTLHKNIPFYALYPFMSFKQCFMKVLRFFLHLKFDIFLPWLHENNKILILRVFKGEKLQSSNQEKIS